MSQWGLSVGQAEGLTEQQVDRLMAAYVARRQFEAKVLLSELGKALAGPEKPQGMSLGALAAMGFRIEGA